ncbi:hypothetical protein I0D68_01370 [Pseudomonas lalucatii]|nr:hypothetical protein [Pseudomonas lalucatii]QVM87770.1 hypothetical protein I0D68_01370 [Pseudomonas lalucatii]
MKDRQTEPSAADEQLLQHYRRHQEQEPPAALDARILAAAREQAERRRSPVGRLARLQRWLFGHATGLRWSLALGSVAALGLGLSLSLKTLERAPAQFASPMPAAPALQRQAAPATKRSMAESARLASPAAEVQADSVAQPAPSGAAPAAGKGAAPAPDARAQAALREVLDLRARGQHGAARERLEALRREHPRLDIEALLERLQEADENGR